MSKEKDFLSLLPNGWFLSNPTRAIQLFEELQKELSSGHILYKKNVKVVAHREETDNILCQHEDDKTRFTVIHLTWSGKEEVAKFPYVVFDGDFNDLLGYVFE